VAIAEKGAALGEMPNQVSVAACVIVLLPPKLCSKLSCVCIKVHNPVAMHAENAAESTPSRIEVGELRQLMQQMRQETQQMRQETIEAVDRRSIETIEAVRLELQSVPTTTPSGCCAIQ
jgi:hypothetical protein